jgi:phosphohistidine phosphatase
MHLYLIRHADAQSAGGFVHADADRPLSDNGEEAARGIGRLLAMTDPGIGLVLTSPLLRAVQTGSLIVEAFEKQPAQQITGHLAPGFRARALTEELLRVGADTHVALIGHQPDISAFLSRLIGGGAGGSIAFAPGSAAFLTASPLGQHLDAQLRWLLTPQLAASFAGRMESRRLR